MFQNTCNNHFLPHANAVFALTLKENMCKVTDVLETCPLRPRYSSSFRPLSTKAIPVGVHGPTVQPPNKGLMLEAISFPASSDLGVGFTPASFSPAYAQQEIRDSSSM